MEIYLDGNEALGLLCEMFGGEVDTVAIEAHGTAECPLDLEGVLKALFAGEAEAETNEWSSPFGARINQMVCDCERERRAAK